MGEALPLRLLALLASSVLLAIAAPVSAELRVSYDAQAKPLKKALRFGDPLGFSLYDNAACERQPVHAEILDVGASTVEMMEPFAGQLPRFSQAPSIRVGE